MKAQGLWLRAVVVAATTLALVACGTTTVYPVDESEVVYGPRRPDPRGTEGGKGRDRGGPEATRPRGVDGVVARCEELLPLTVATSRRLGVDWALIAAITTVESKWTASAKNRSGASGLMQVMPSTGRRMKCGDLLDAADNLSCGARLLKRLLDRYEGQVPYALAAYAAGAKSVDAAFKAGRRPPRERFVSRVMTLADTFSNRGCEAVR